MLLFPLMCKFPFNIVLPTDIINYIYIFVLKENSLDTILHHYKLIQEKTFALKNIISHMVYYDIYYTYDNKCFQYDLLDNLNCILLNDFSRKIYRHEFWQHLLHLISNRLMNMYNRFCINGIDKRTNSEYKQFLQMIEVWFKLCKKYNIKLHIIKYEYFNKSMISRSEYNTRKMLPIKNLSKYVYAPNVILNNNDCVNTNEAIEILKYYLVY